MVILGTVHWRFSGNQNRFFYGITAKTPFWNLILRVYYILNDKLVYIDIY